MAMTNRTIESPKIGQTIRFLATAADTDGTALVIEARMRPGAFIPPHRHLHQTETFEVLTGTGTFTVGRRRVAATAGQRIHIPVGRPHAFRNRTGQDVQLRATMRPALRAEELFERLFTLGAQGRVNRLGAPHPLECARLIREFREEFFYVAVVPVALQRLLAGARR
jgi:mannose-6-phosphate isomerase-like protein (cupin superfamily)